MKMEMGIGLVQRLELNPELTDPDKEKLEAAYELWQDKQRLDFAVPADTLRIIFGDPSASSRGRQVWETEWREQFVMVTPQEMRRIADGEKFAVLLGNCIYVSTETPADYISLGVLNLAALRRARDDSAFAQTLKAKGLSSDYARHYTASLTDVLAAQHIFRDQPEKLAAFLHWRKSVERTGFFSDDTVGEILAKKLQTRQRASQLHPTERGRYTKQSFVLATALESTMTRSQVDGVVRSMGVTKADIIIGRIKNEPSFDVTVMMEMIDAVVRRIRELSAGKSLPKNKRTITVTGSQSVQAYLLTEDMCGVSSILIQTANPNVFLAMQNAAASLIALKDRLLYFSKQALARVVPEHKDMAALRSLIIGTQQLVPLPQLVKTVPADVTTGNTALANIETKRDELNRRLAEAETLLAQYAEVERAFAALGAKESVPGVLAQDRQSIQEHLNAIKSQLDELSQYEVTLGHLATVRARLGHFLGQISSSADS